MKAAILDLNDAREVLEDLCRAVKDNFLFILFRQVWVPVDDIQVFKVLYYIWKYFSMQKQFFNVAGF